MSDEIDCVYATAGWRLYLALTMQSSAQTRNKTRYPQIDFWTKSFAELLFKRSTNKNVQISCEFATWIPTLLYAGTRQENVVRDSEAKKGSAGGGGRKWAIFIRAGPHGSVKVIIDSRINVNRQSSPGISSQPSIRRSIRAWNVNYFLHAVL